MIIIEEIESDCLPLLIDIVIVDNTINETIDVKHNTDNIVSTIINIIGEFGYTEIMGNPKSNKPNSNSLYFTFCNENKFNSEEVELIIRMRVSDHDLPRWKTDKTGQDAKVRQLNDLKAFAHNNRFINKNLKADEEIPVEYIYVKYENEYYSDIEEVYAKIRQKLREFQNKHK